MLVYRSEGDEFLHTEQQAKAFHDYHKIKYSIIIVKVFK